MNQIRCLTDRIRSMGPKSHRIMQYVLGSMMNFSVEKARNRLELYWHDSKSSCFEENEISKASGKYDCSIIIPVYNTEKFIDACIKSVIEQVTDYTVQIIVIDDGSTDHTGELLKKYENIPDLTVIHQNNAGLSGARNTGIRNSDGKYLLFVDSDDRLHGKNAVDKLLTVAFQYDADIVDGNYVSVSIDGTINYEVNKYRDERVAPQKTLFGHACGKIYARHLFRHLRFPEKYWFEDSVNAQIIFPMAQKVYTISDIIYEYTSNPVSITHTTAGNPKSLDSLYITEALLKDKSRFGLELDSKDLRYFLKMVRLTYARTEACKVVIVRSVFIVQCELYQQFDKVRSVDEKDRELERALRNRDFKGYLRAVWKAAK